MVCMIGQLIFVVMLGIQSMSNGKGMVREVGQQIFVHVLVI